MRVRQTERDFTCTTVGTILARTLSGTPRHGSRYNGRFTEYATSLVVCVALITYFLVYLKLKRYVCASPNC